MYAQTCPALSVVSNHIHFSSAFSRNGITYRCDLFRVDQPTYHSLSNWSKLVGWPFLFFSLFFLFFFSSLFFAFTALRFASLFFCLFFLLFSNFLFFLSFSLLFFLCFSFLYSVKWDMVLVQSIKPPLVD